VAVNDLRYGFDFTIPLVNAQQWLDIFKPAAAPTTEPVPSETPSAMPSAMPSAAPTSGARPTPAPSAKPASNFNPGKFFGANCAGCHGAAGQGGFGPNLKPVEAKGDAFITNRILHGSPKGMPPFEGRLTGEELQALVTYVKGL
jgi:mono/diheme cytochrome c family protein